ncbi:MAG: GWxTD domain-containing protein [Candidatus Aminicenantes bacterium]|nr:GWxTD domain-containing protein [Candidatus Aminicenantes bacterium]
MNKRTGVIVLFLTAGLGLLATYGGGAKVALDPESKKFYETTNMIMSREEVKIFKRLPDPESRKEFIADFWAKRDPNPDNDVNEFKVEFENRIAYVTKRFKTEGGPGWNTDRGRIYIFMGPPDKFDEYFNHGDATVRGSILRWVYYNYMLVIEFVDEKGNGQFKIRNYEGDFFGAIDILKLGTYVGTNDVFLKKIVNFNLTYDRTAGEIEVTLPAKLLNFKENDAGKFQIDLRFKFYIYEGPNLGKKILEEERTFESTTQELGGLKTIPFRFSIPLKPGANFVDVIIQGKQGTASKIRKLFEIKASS